MGRLPALALLSVLPFAVRAQQSTTAQGALAGRVLLAESRRDSTDADLRSALTSSDARLRTLAQRALGRIRDPKYATRDSLPPVTPAPAYADPAWRLRFRALKSPNGDCAPHRTSLTDSAWAVRIRAMDLVDASCASDDALATALTRAIDALPADASLRARGGVSWHAGAHALVALARLRPADARTRLPTRASHTQWQVRAYTARAAAVLADTATLRTLARDPDDNVKEAAIEALAKLTGHADDALYLATLNATGAQAVRAAAAALKGSTHADVVSAANAAFERWVARNNASAHDARTALLAAAGRPITDDRSPTFNASVPARAADLALGADIRLRVTMSSASGGGSFVVRLRGDVAPIMAARILELANRHYYDGLTWHRVEPDFVIQGGSPGATEYIGYKDFLRDELGTIPHPRGTVGMSTRGHDTGDAQWFVNLRDNARLTRDYTVFGEVVEGIDVVDGVLEGDIIRKIEEITRKPH